MAEIDQSNVLPAPMKLEQYTLTRVLSVGGFGVVYLAEDNEAEVPKPLYKTVCPIIVSYTF